MELFGAFTAFVVVCCILSLCFIGVNLLWDYRPPNIVESIGVIVVSFTLFVCTIWLILLFSLISFI
ncbi:hypothetical protein Phab24_id068 [Acinetobacter phage Phab24]|nr:hypothetical protein Phab24_id068 [Acinetobacter phage Phab24]